MMLALRRLKLNMPFLATLASRQAAHQKARDFKSGRVKMQNGRQEQEDNRTLFVKNLPYSATTDSLQEYFPDSIDIRIPLNQRGGSRGFAFIQFESGDKAESILKEMQGTEIDGREIMLDFDGQKSNFASRRGGYQYDRPRGEYNQSQAEPGSTKVLCIRNLPDSTTEEGLREYFDDVIEVRLLTYRNSGKSMGRAFLEFNSPDEATAAYEAKKNLDIDGRITELYYAEERGPGGGRG